MLVAKQPLKKMPLHGGMAAVSKAPAAPATIVGVHQGYADAAKKATVVKERKKKMFAKGVQTAKGVTRAPPFSVWFDDELVGKYALIGGWQAALPDIKQKRPGEYMSQNLLSCLLGIKKSELLKKKFVKEKFEATKFTAKYDSD